MKQKLFTITKDDFEIKFFSGRGAGGQARNRHMNCVRMKHKATGVSAIGQNSRSKKDNIRQAFLTITKNKKFKSWVNRQASIMIHEGITLEEKVNRMLSPENLKIEYF